MFGEVKLDVSSLLGSQLAQRGDEASNQSLPNRLWCTAK